MDLHIIGRSVAFNLFPRTYRGKSQCVLRQKHALINSRERTRIWLHTRHQDEAIEPRRDRSIDVKGRRQIAAKALDFRYFSAHDSFERVERVIVCGNLSKGKSAQKV